MATGTQDELAPATPAGHVMPQTQALALLDKLQPADTLTWLGHASFLVRLGGQVILTDPFLTDYASPFVGIGPRRHVAPGIAIEHLPQIDIVVISHNHYDHFDRRTLAQLRHPERITAVVPSGLGESLREFGFKQVRELTWGRSTSFDALQVTAVPAIHFSSRGLFDRNETLWAGFVFSSAKAKVYFAGDTGYHSSIFGQIGKDFGPIDAALVPIGAYEPRNLMGYVHVNPEEAVAIGRDLGAKTLVAMHWGTIVLATEPPFEPPVRFRAAGKAAGYADDALWVMQIGQTRALR
jgi:N-acyl-phosphatidylethanolamine-hydrolysing phospholipase D